MPMGLCKHDHGVLHLQLLKFRKWRSTGEDMLSQYFFNEASHHHVHVFFRGIHQSLAAAQSCSFHCLPWILRLLSIIVMIALVFLFVILTHASKARTKEEEVELLIVFEFINLRTSFLSLFLDGFRFYLLDLLFISTPFATFRFLHRHFIEIMWFFYGLVLLRINRIRILKLRLGLVFHWRLFQIYSWWLIRLLLKLCIHLCLSVSPSVMASFL